NERILETADGRAAYRMRLEMKPGPQKISVGVRDRLGRVDSTLSLALEVGTVTKVSRLPETPTLGHAERAADSATAVASR
ncbi:MAG: hypothetical protein ACE5EG_11730, partial [Thermoanaerobaculia bacterium]